MGRRRRAPTLAVYLEALVGQRVVVELQNDTIIRGRLASVGEGLDLQIEEATVRPLQGEQRAAEFICLRGSHIRFVHTPPGLTPDQAVAAAARKRADALAAHAAAQGRHAPAAPKGQY